MSKLSLILFTLSIASSNALAANQKTFFSAGAPCKLAKSVGGRWVTADERELSGQTLNAQVSKANADFSNFKLGGTWYAVKNSCLADLTSASPAIRRSRKYFVELRAQKYLMLGAGVLGGETGSAGITNGPLTSSVGVGGRLGWYWTPERVFFLDVNQLSANQNTTYTGATTGTSTYKDSILMVNVGVMIPFRQSVFHLMPYAALSLGYAKFSQDFAGVLSSQSIAIKDSTATFNVKLEGGVAYPLSAKFDAIFSAAYTYLSIGSAKIDSSNLSTAPVGSSLSNSVGFSHVTAALGLRYNL